MGLAQYGGAIDSTGNVAIKDCIFEGNTASHVCLPKQLAPAAGLLMAHSSALGLAQNGGAIYNNGNADIKDCKFEGNTASQDCRRVRSRQY